MHTQWNPESQFNQAPVGFWSETSKTLKSTCFDKKCSFLRTTISLLKQLKVSKSSTVTYL